MMIKVVVAAAVKGGCHWYRDTEITRGLYLLWLGKLVSYVSEGDPPHPLYHSGPGKCHPDGSGFVLVYPLFEQPAPKKVVLVT